MSLHDNVTVGLLCLSGGAAALVTVVTTSFVVHIRHREIRRQAEHIRRWADARPERRALPTLNPLPDGFEEVPEAPVVYAWWTPSKEDLTETAVLPRMTDDILTAEALRFEVTQVLQTIPWRPATTTVPSRRGHLDVIEGYARAGRHRAGPR
ncbi:hypothetical protein HDA40_001191 [Hamadaea flava]|uniref:Secreted protein n=1 Tax=Hamadaea flava TaxID=1742688 RepID=A0ABV8LQT5_9ACTN|nr:hypothetical protein [Hamadaea flava]MCP2322684.1 hypothetical protein [Hamadaea flava]